MEGRECFWKVKNEKRKGNLLRVSSGPVKAEDDVLLKERRNQTR